MASLLLQQWYDEAVNGSGPGSWQTIHSEEWTSYQQEFSLDPADVGHGRFRFMVLDRTGLLHQEGPVVKL